MFLRLRPLPKLRRINQVNPGFPITSVRRKYGVKFGPVGLMITRLTDPSRLRTQVMSLDEARQVIACWLESIDSVDPVDLTEGGLMLPYRPMNA